MIIHYKCPNCGADMEYDADLGKLHCPSCGRVDEIETFPEDNINKTFSQEDGKEYHCGNCGAIIITDNDTTATTCSFCGAGVVIEDRLSGEMAPSKLIPFSISKERAQEAFKKWAGNGRLTPRGFMTGERIKNISGMYIPFWLYDLNTRAKLYATGTKVRTYRQGDWMYTETRYYDVYRDINLDYLKVPVDASKKMHDDLMDLIEPYDYKELKEFKSPYLVGYVAEKYNYDQGELLPRAKAKIDSYIRNYINSTTSEYTSVRTKNIDLDTKNKSAYYTLLPVWVVYYDYKGKEYFFAMNGQTGKVVGQPPISKKKVVQWFLSIFILSFVFIRIIFLLIGGKLW